LELYGKLYQKTTSWQKPIIKKDDFRKEVAFFDIIGDTISCGWCKQIYSSLILLYHTSPKRKTVAGTHKTFHKK
jgi:hypothetical protein